LSIFQINNIKDISQKYKTELFYDMTRDEAIVKMQRYCSYRDRCHHEVRYKLDSLKVYGEQLEEVMSQLIQDGYLSDERYAKSFARGKYRIKKWGKVRITRELKAKQISDYCIRQAMKEIDEEGDYLQTIQQVISKYLSTRKDNYDKRKLHQKAYEHAFKKGFESALISEVLSES